MPVQTITPKDWERIAQMRYEGMTQQQVAEQIGCQKQAIGLLERNNKEYQAFNNEFLRGIAFEAGRKFAREREADSEHGTDSPTD